VNEDRVSELVREADWVPEAPDCRAAVIERIRAPERRRYAWAHVCAALAAIAVGTWALLPHAQRHSALVTVVKKAPAQPEAVVRNPAPAAPEKPKAIEKHIAKAPRRMHVVYRAAKRVDRPRTAAVVPVPRRAVEQAPAPSVAIKDRPVAIAIVTWPSETQRPSDTYSYGYTDRDVRTGQITECRVTRSGDSVEIYMESKPEAKQPPVKGSIGYEPKPSA
jgi:hypothetical protein